MHPLSKKILCLLALTAAAPSALAFSLLGPYAVWQTAQLGYRQTNDIGGPMWFHSFYRWNITNITYAYDQSFINYFGTNGIKAVDDAFAVLNSLPPSSRLNIDDYPLDSKLWNPLAQQAQLLDLKSHTLAMLLNYMGLADPERFAWTLYHRAASAVQTNYYTIQMNFDPDTYQPTSRVNAIYYSYHVVETNGIADAVEDYVTYNDHLPYSSVAGGHLGAGYLYAGLTRDDAAGIKYLLSTNTLAVEGLLTNVFQGGPSQFVSYGWIPYINVTNLTNANLTNVVTAVTNGSNVLITVGIRPGMNKVLFRRVEFDSLLGNTFTNAITNFYTDTLIVTNKLVSQRVYRVISYPDIVFLADHLGFTDTVAPDGTITTTPNLIARTDTAGWINNDTLNGLTTEGGPGVISPGTTNATIQIRFSSDLGGLYNSNPYFWDEQWSTTGPIWATFDQTTNAPIIYPVYEQITIDELLSLINTFTNYTPGTLLSTPPR